jgi:hypothetical protein
MYGKTQTRHSFCKQAIWNQQPSDTNQTEIKQKVGAVAGRKGGQVIQFPFNRRTKRGNVPIPPIAPAPMPPKAENAPPQPKVAGQKKGSSSLRVNPPVSDTASGANLERFQTALAELTALCAEAAEKSVLHWQGADPWVLGAIPTCGVLADRAEARARALLADATLTPEQAETITLSLKSCADLRAVSRATRQSVQLAWLDKSERGGDEATMLILRVAEPSLRVARATSDALIHRDFDTARDAALLFREVDEARREAEILTRLRMPNGLDGAGRTAMAGIWFTAIIGEGMARVAARWAGLPDNLGR